MAKQWKCLVCGYIHEGDQPPDICPVCGADKSQFELVEEQGTKASAPARPGGAVTEHLHPILAHFPNGLMPAIAFLLVAGAIFQRPALEESVVWLIGLVTLVAPLNMLTGIQDWRRYFGGAKAPIFKQKILFGCLLMVLGVFALLVRLVGGDELFPLYLACLAGMLGCAGYLGYLGGQLMFGAAGQGEKS